MMAENMQNGMVRLREGGEGSGLFPVLQPKGNPYAESHPTGDLWLQSMWKEGRVHSLRSIHLCLFWLPVTISTCAQSCTLSSHQASLMSAYSAGPALWPCYRCDIMAIEALV